MATVDRVSLNMSTIAGELVTNHNRESAHRLVQVVVGLDNLFMTNFRNFVVLKLKEY